MVIAGLLQVIATDLNLSVTRAGYLITAYALGFAFGAPVLGAITGRFCRKQVVVVGLLIVAAGSLWGAFIHDAHALVASRMVVAFGASLVIPSVSAIAAFIAAPVDRPRALAQVIMGMTLAMVIGVPAGTWLGGQVGWHVTLALAALLATVAAGAIKWLLPGGINVPPVPFAAWRALLGNWRAHALIASSMLHLMAVFTLFTYIAPFLYQVGGLQADKLSLMLAWFGVAGLSGNILLSVIGARIKRDRLFLAAIILTGCAVFAMNWTHYSIVVAVLAGGLWSLVGNFFVPLQQARMLAFAPHAGAAILALNISAVFVGQALGSLVGGLVSERFGLDALPFAAAALTLVTLGYILATRGLIKIPAAAT